MDPLAKGEQDLLPPPGPAGSPFASLQRIPPPPSHAAPPPPSHRNSHHHTHTPSHGSLFAAPPDFVGDHTNDPSHQSHRKKASRSSLASILPHPFRRTQSVASAGTLKKLEPTDPIVILRNIHKTYLLGLEGVAALRGVSLSIQRGEWVAVYGTSGGGKTSLLNIIGTIDKPTKGDLTICDTVITPNTKDEVLASLRLNKLGFVFQSFNLISSMTALENVELPMVLKGSLTAQERKARAIASLKRVGLEHRLHHFPSKLSGGEQQRVTIARAIANLPEVLLLDEPTGDLDTQNTLRILHLLHTLNVGEMMTFVMVTHDVYLKNFAHRVVYMRDGKIHRVEMTRSQKRKEALEELEAKVAEGEGRNVARAATSAEGAPNSDLHTRPVGTVTGESAHQPGQYVSRATEVREPGDYATYCVESGVPAKAPDIPARQDPQLMPSESRDKLNGPEHHQIDRRDGKRILRSMEDLDHIV
ncbi:hypothetical protein PhCBS80983_g03375 [Powellomyces hirtus]|uniref:ABC transporter domain-containing protein n=1 Tax=Powellomyces hirtus TaxID=109895 RepID=A0A507E454_9FUNG|nr:hypothetical protein PhCBS80983_g03375 [Powellomyces hirtus]